MAGDWIKMRGNLWDDPRVSRLCDLTESTEAAIVGGLYWLWATADQHSEDGYMPGLTLRQIDRKTGIQGFGKALCKIGWLFEEDMGVVLCRFDEHNGSSAKRRCMDAQRKANFRSVSASDADKPKTEDGRDAEEMRRLAELEKEKRREEDKPLPVKPGQADPAGFAEFWSAWPNTDRKADRKKCAAKWGKESLGQKLPLILANVSALKATKKWIDGFEPAPLTYLNGERWADGVEVDSPAGEFI